MVYYNSELDKYESYYHVDVDVAEPLDAESDALVYGDTAEYHLGNRYHHHHASDDVFPLIGHAFSGAVGAALSNLVTYPLSVVTTRMQVQQEMARELEERSRRRRRDRKGAELRIHTPGEFLPERLPHMRLGSHDEIDVSEIYGEDEGTYSYDGLWDTAETIYADSGLRGFYAGVGWDCLSTVSAGFWYFAAYQLLRRQRLHILSLPHNPNYKNPAIPILEELGFGIAAGAAARFIAYPLSTIVTRKQTAAMLYPHVKSPNVIDIAKDIMHRNGVKGFWAGYEASVLLTANPSITFLLYESAKTWILGRRRGDKLQARETFLLAAVCKALATAITYPLSVARSRAQVVERPKMGKGKKSGGVMETLTEIVRIDGVGALWQGVEAEILKGFFTHGITMIIKEAVHRAIIRLYFFVLHAYKHTPQGTIKQTVQQIAKETYENAGPREKALIDQASQVAGLTQNAPEEKDDEKLLVEEHRVEERRALPPSRIPVAEYRNAETALVRKGTTTAAAVSHAESPTAYGGRARSSSIRSSMSSQRGRIDNTNPYSRAPSVAASSRNGDSSRALMSPVKRTPTSPTPYRGRTTTSPTARPPISPTRRLTGAQPPPERTIEGWRQEVTETTTTSPQESHTHTPHTPARGNVLRRSSTFASPTASQSPAHKVDIDVLRERRISEVAESLKGRAPARREVPSDARTMRTHFSTARASESDSTLVHPPSEVRAGVRPRATPAGPPNTPKMGHRDVAAPREMGMREELEWRRAYDKDRAIGGGDVSIGGAVAAEAQKWDDPSAGRGWK